MICKITEDLRASLSRTPGLFGAGSPRLLQPSGSGNQKGEIGGIQCTTHGLITMSTLGFRHPKWGDFTWRNNDDLMVPNMSCTCHSKTHV